MHKQQDRWLDLHLTRTCRWLIIWPIKETAVLNEWNAWNKNVHVWTKKLMVSCRLQRSRHSLHQSMSFHFVDEWIEMCCFRSSGNYLKKKFPASPNFPIPFKFRILIADWLIYRSWKFQLCKQNGFCEINFKVKRVSLFFKKIFLPYLISGLTWNLCSTKLVISTTIFKNLNFVVNLVFVIRIFKCDPI